MCGVWRLGREIGRGAYGVVYAAANAGGERAAVKICRRDDIGGERYERELRGARLYSAIPQHEGLVRMRELAEEPWGFYAVMDLADDEFCRAGSDLALYRPKTLASVIDGEKALPLGACVRLGVALANGLAALQRHHLLHRDIKPGNVVFVGGRPALSDPGLVVEEAEAASLVGTPGFVPPEGFTAAPGDIYCLGLTLKAASFGRRVEDLDKGPALEADTGAALFPAWWRILNKATDTTPSRRYQSAKALLKDMERLRFKMAVTAVFGARIVKAAIALAVAGAVAAAAYSVVSGRRMQEDLVKQSETDRSLKEEIARQSNKVESLEDFDAAEVALVERALRDTFPKWPEERIEDELLMFKSAGRYSSWPGLELTAKGRSSVDFYVDEIKSGIAEIDKVDKVKAAELKSSFGKLLGNLAYLDAKDETLKNEIVALHSKAREKVKKGTRENDKEEFLQGQKLFNQRNMLFEDIRLRMKEFSQSIQLILNDLKIIDSDREIGNAIQAIEQRIDSF